MILLFVKEMTRQFDAAPVLNRVTFDVRAGEKIGLVGPNGTGKTTLLRILAGEDDADHGTIETASACTVARLEQEATIVEGRTLLEEAKSGLAHLYQLQEHARELADRMACEADPQTLESLKRKYDQSQHELHRLNAYNVDHRVDEVLQGLGFCEQDYDRPLSDFSGGQQNRVLLARLLLNGPELMLLDEPTNHLDMAATEWLEGFLSRSDKAMILVSHDRYFLDRVTDRILELHQGTLTSYRGNFSSYWRQRQERNELLRRTVEKQQDFVTRTEEFVRRNHYGQKHGQAADRLKKLERLERVELPQDITVPPMRFGEAARSGDWVLDATDVEKGFGTPLFTDLSLQVERGDRLAILGPNGSGKTTLLRTLIRDLEPDRGVIRFGSGIKIGYFDQHLAHLDPDLDAIENARPPNDPDVTPGDARSLLARFGLRGDIVFQRIGSMSGGEKSKVALARLSALNANVLVLDEPTNHLDLWSRDGLETALKAFPGTLLFVSHDRYFVDRLATRVIVLDPPQWKHYEGNYSDYVQFVSHTAQDTVDASTAPAAEVKVTSPAKGSGSQRSGKPLRRKRKFPYRKVEDLEQDVAQKEALILELEAQLADPNVNRDAARIQETTRAYDQARAELEQLYAHWEEALELN